MMGSKWTVELGKEGKWVVIDEDRKVLGTFGTRFDAEAFKTKLEDEEAAAGQGHS
jgi:hypothetical protein